MSTQIFININGKTNVFSFDKSTKSLGELKNDLFQFIEDKTKIHKMFFRFTFAGKSHRWLDDSEMQFNSNTTYEFDFDHLLKKVRISNDENIFVNSPLLDESGLLVSMKELCDEGLVNSDDVIHLGDTDIVNKTVIENWIVLSHFLRINFNSVEDFYKNITLPKPLPNNFLEKSIGKKSFEYLDNLELDQLKSFATFCDYMDIGYLLEIVCAFIANKYVKNKSLSEIKDLNLI